MPKESENFDQALKIYQDIYPDVKFPEDLNKELILKAIKNSRGRKIYFTKQKDSYSIYFEDDQSDTIEIPKWNKLIGCGG